MRHLQKDSQEVGTAEEAEVAAVLVEEVEVEEETEEEAEEEEEGEQMKVAREKTHGLQKRTD